MAVAVNLSARQFRELDLVESVRRALDASELGGLMLRVEITETAVMESIEASSMQLRELRAMGVNVALDDFWIGQSSMTYLKHLPLDEVKIDRSFIRDISSHDKDFAIVKAIIAMAHSLHLVVTGEGVETEQQGRAVKSFGLRQSPGIFSGSPGA